MNKERIGRYVIDVGIGRIAWKKRHHLAEIEVEPYVNLVAPDVEISIVTVVRIRSVPPNIIHIGVVSNLDHSVSADIPVAESRVENMVGKRLTEMRLILPDLLVHRS